MRTFSVVSMLSVAVCGMGLLCGCAADGLHADGLTNTSQSLQAPAFAAPFDPQMGQVVISVSPVEVAVPQGSTLGDLGETVRAQLISTLSSSPNILVADRRAMAEIAAEQQLNHAGATTNHDRPSMGQLAAVRYLVKATVTEFQETVQGHAQGQQIQLGPILSIAGSFAGGEAGHILSAVATANPTLGHNDATVEGMVGLELQIVDVQSGLVIGQTRAMGKLTAKNSSTVLGIAGISGTDARFTTSVLGQATRACAEDATREIHTILRGRMNVTASAAISDSSVAAGTSIAK